MSSHTATLHLLCGKIASGKSTLADQLARQSGAVLLAEDHWIAALYGEQITSISDYLQAMGRLRGVMGPHIVTLLQAGQSVVLDFQANTVRSRAWMRGILDQTQARHRLHHLDVPDDVCRNRLRARNAGGTHPFAATEADFDEMARHFVPPEPDEGFDVVVHSLSSLDSAG